MRLDIGNIQTGHFTQTGSSAYQQNQDVPQFAVDSISRLQEQLDLFRRERMTFLYVWRFIFYPERIERVSDAQIVIPDCGTYDGMGDPEILVDGRSRDLPRSKVIPEQPSIGSGQFSALAYLLQAPSAGL